MVRKQSAFLAAIMVYCIAAVGQTYSGTGGVIPDNGSPIIFAIPVSGLPVPSIDTVYGLESVCINITHTWDADLEIVLIAPDQSYVDLVAGHGGGDDNFTNTCFNGNSEDPIIHAWAPFTGTFRPFGDLGVVNNGQNGNGTWMLYILDTYAFADQGYLLSWSLNFSNQPSKPFKFESSNLPIVVINTMGQLIPDDPKIMARMGIIDNGPGNRNYIADPFNNYDGFIGIERRGSSSQGFPKKSFGFETWDSLGGDIDVSLLGMPDESDWILNAHYSDKTLMRNVITYYLANRMGHYASRTRFCELLLNGQYWGVYAFMEKVKRDKNRVDIAKLNPEDTTGTDVTGGYILKIDKITGSGGQGWTSPFPPPVHQQGQTIFIQYEYPDPEDIRPQQEAYIQSYVDTFETALFHFPGGNYGNYNQYMDIGSFVDYFILNELSRNIDGYRLSTFFHKDKGGKVVMGPVWDYDIAWNNAYYCDGSNTQGWAYQFGSVCPEDPWQLPFWWDKLMTDPEFINQLRCRWETLRLEILDTDSLLGYINGQVNLLQESQARNFRQWPILGYWVWPNPWPVPETYEGEITALNLFILSRLIWLDNNMPGECPGLQIKEASAVDVTIYPNPVKDFLSVSLNGYTGKDPVMELINPEGKILWSSKYNGNTLDPNREIVTVPCRNLPPGIYLLKVKLKDQIITKKILKVRTNN